MFQAISTVYFAINMADIVTYNLPLLRSIDKGKGP